MQYEANTKQPPQTSDPRFSNAYQIQKKNNSKIIKAIKYMDSSEPTVVIKGLNIITQKSYESTDAMPLHLEAFPELILSLGCLLDTVNPLGHLLHQSHYHDFILDRSNTFWPVNLPSTNIPKFQVGSQSVDDNVLLLTILNILRNLSFEFSNEIIISSSVVVLRHLLCVVLAALEGQWPSEASAMALDILVNIGGRIDCTGRRRWQLSSAFLEDVLADDRNRSVQFMRCSAHMAPESSAEYSSVAATLFPLVHRALVGVAAGGTALVRFDSRMFVVRCLELLGKLSQVPENVVMVCRSPDSLLRALVDLLCVSNSVLEPIAATTDLSSAVIGDPIGRTRPPAVTLIGGASGCAGIPSQQLHAQQAPMMHGTGYFSADHCDLELRDLAVDCLLSFCLAAPVMQTRVADTPGVVELLQRIASAPIATGGVSGTGGGKTEGNAKAVQVLGLIFSLSGARNAYLSVKTHMVVAASADDAVADVVCSKAVLHNYPLVVAPQPIVASQQAVTDQDATSMMMPII